MQRRKFLNQTACSLGGALLTSGVFQQPMPSWESSSRPLGPIHSFEPVVGDGRWIWREPPEKSRGYLEPRSYELSVGIELKGSGNLAEALAYTPVPLNHPEQRVDEVTIEKIGCDAVIRELSPDAGQLILYAPGLANGQIVKAIAHYKLTLFKQYQGFEQDQFPVEQTIPKKIRMSAMGDSPGIQTNSSIVRKLANQISYGLTHPWSKAQAFVQWIQRNIRPQYGPYTSVLTAIEKKVGDCEEMSSLFVAFCRASEIPSRLVWVPNHNWTEFYLTDHEGKGHWIPVHPACYHWFGWTGVHELVIQKGDRVHVPEQNKTFRLVMDWIRTNGNRPYSNYLAELKPLPPTPDGDAGPGTRSKDSKTGEWKLTGKHEQDRFARR